MACGASCKGLTGGLWPPSRGGVFRAGLGRPAGLFPQEIRGGNAEGLSQLLQNVHRNRAIGAFRRSQMARAYPRSIGKLLLRPAEFGPPLSELLSKCFPQISHASFDAGWKHPSRRYPAEIQQDASESCDRVLGSRLPSMGGAGTGFPVKEFE